MRIAFAGLMILLILPLGRAAAQQQQPAQDQQADSPAEAARRAREQKKDQPKAAKVWDNDNVPTAGSGVNVVGSSEAAGGESANPQEAAQGPVATEAEKGAPKSPKDMAAAQADLSAAKERLRSLKTDLDLLQRKFALDSQTYLSNPNHSTDTAGADALADEKSQIEAKQAEVDAAQKKVEELEAKLKDSGAGSENSSSNPNSPPQ
jgi:polyhydroxyalkanoate synthesis regulator phasin